MRVSDAIKTVANCFMIIRCSRFGKVEMLQLRKWAQQETVITARHAHDAHDASHDARHCLLSLLYIPIFTTHASHR